MDLKSRQGVRYQCPKCRGHDWEVGEIRVSGGFWSSIFDVENRYFTHLTCMKCNYTEFYKVRASNFSSVTDFLFS